MSMKSLRLDKNWSQEQLAQLSGLNVRTIQRVEKGQSVGLESMKCLAAVFEMSLDELKMQISDKKQGAGNMELESTNENLHRKKAHEKVKSIKNFYFFSAFMVVMFLLFYVPNYNNGENLGPLIVGFISFAILIGIYGYAVFQPFGEKWEEKKVAKILREERDDENSKSEL